MKSKVGGALPADNAHRRDSCATKNFSKQELGNEKKSLVAQASRLCMDTRGRVSYTETFRTRLEDYLRRHRRAALLFSGGLDSSLLLAVASRILGSGLTAITFCGPHTTPGELAAAWTLTRRFRVTHVVREINPLDLPDFRNNTRRRCYACKQAVITAAGEIARRRGATALWDGTNRDDLADFRPGLQAARELGVESPLLEAGLDKPAIRVLSRDLGLDWDKPSQSCLATRFLYDTLLTREALARVGQAEAWLRGRGFTHVRLRVRGDRVRLELFPEEWPGFLAPAVRRPFTALISRLGWQGLDLDG